MIRRICNRRFLNTSSTFLASKKLAHKGKKMSASVNITNSSFNQEIESSPKKKPKQKVKKENKIESDIKPSIMSTPSAGSEALLIDTLGSLSIATDTDQTAKQVDEIDKDSVTTIDTTNNDTSTGKGNPSPKAKILLKRKPRKDVSPKDVSPKDSNFEYGNIAKGCEWVKDEDTIFISIDVEQWERKTTYLTEIGITLHRPSNLLLPETRAAHFVIEEYQNYRNGRFVPDNKYNFSYGDTLTLSYANCVHITNQIINQAVNSSKRAVIVGHNVKGDIKALREIGIVFPSTIKVLDTMNIWREKRPEGPGSLEGLLILFQIPFSFLHNAGELSILYFIFFYYNLQKTISDSNLLLLL